MDVVKAGGLEDPRGHFGIPEREWIQARWRRLHRVAKRGVDQPHPFVVLEALPHEQHESRLCSQCGGDVRERGGRIGEEHGPNRLIATSKLAGSKRCTCASPRS